MKFALVALVLLLQACSAGLRRPSPPESGAVRADQGRIVSSPQRALADASCFGGLPVERNADVGPTELVIRAGYVLEHSSTDKIPLWVCESVSVGQLGGVLKRDNAFRTDPDLQGEKSYPGDYGHAYEWTGPIRCDARARAAMPSARECRRTTIGQNAVAVPLYFYKIILVQDQTSWKAIAFVMPNVDYHCPCRLDPYVVSIDAVERDTGIEFMPNLDPRERHRLKATASPMWP
jgi:DNA/RNA endonuclease G (NUC1)